MKLYLYITNPADYAAGGQPNFFGDSDTHMDGEWHRFAEIDVDLPNRADCMKSAEAQIDEVERRTKEEFEKRMAAIRDQRAKLLAIAHEVSQ